jgi:hypothetical protein
LLDRFVKNFSSWLIHRKFIFSLFILSIILTLPALWVGWQLDDHFHRFMMSEFPEFGYRPINVFTVLDGDQQSIDEYIDYGALPWWTARNYRLMFFRYLSVFFMWIDYQLWPNSPWIMHFHSLLWYGALVVAAGLLFRRIMGVIWPAGLAALMYALDEAHALPVSWLANRNALLSTFFGILCLIAYDAWRRKRSKWGGFLSPICLILGLCAGEMALAALGYLFAYMLFLDQASWRRRLKSFLPIGGVLLIYFMIYRYFNFGSHGSGYYMNPFGDPVAFMKTFFFRAPLLFMGQWSPIPADMAILLPTEMVHNLWIGAIGLFVLLAFLFYPLIRKDNVARFWCLGMMLSLLPISAVSPSNRLLFFVGLGAMGLLALFLKGLIEKSGWLPSPSAWRMIAWGLAAYFIVLNLILAPFAMPINAYAIKPFGEQVDKAIATVPSDKLIEDQDLVLVNPPDYLLFASNIGTLKILEGKSFPKRIRALGVGSIPMELIRVDERTLNVRISGGLFADPLGRLFRAKDDPMKVGEEVQLTGMNVHVTKLTENGDPQEVVFRFSVPLEDSSLRWLKWKEGIYVPFTPPEKGCSVIIPRSRSPFEILK